MLTYADRQGGEQAGGGQRGHLATASGATEGGRGAFSSAHRDSSVCDTTMDGASVIESPLSSPLSARCVSLCTFVLVKQ